ncbi:hypothetical protein CNR22_22505 [Sphingobacteriaceae bacterium]|nr:hypothetical protein CNR22_22505 [Sphingobacteriaceae bacterium]
MKLLFASLVWLPLFALSQSTLPAKKYHFLSVSFGGGPAYPTGTISKKSDKENLLGKYKSGGSFRFNIEGYFKEKLGLGLGMDYGFYKLNNQLLADSIMGHFAGKRVYKNYIPEEVLLVRGAVYGCISGYFKLGTRCIIQPKINFGGGFLSYSYSPVISYSDNNGREQDSWMDGSTISYASIVPELAIKFILVKGKWADLALDGSVNYFYYTPAFTITEFKGDTYSSFSTYQTTDFMKLKGPLSYIGTHLGVTWLFKVKRKN